jgi:NitT/TauT family transport system substrate-binding protein
MLKPMKLFFIYPIFFASLVLAIPVTAQEVIVYEAGPIHMETAGGWVAVEKGFYAKFNVKQIQGALDISPVQKVIASTKEGNIAFGCDSPENILRGHQQEGVDLVAVSVDFQSSSMRIISWKPVRSSKEIKGDFGIWMGYEAKPKCAAGRGWEKQFTIQNQGEDIQPWLKRHWPLASAMTYNELIIAQRETKKMGRIFYTIDYRDLGIDWMDHVLFTTEEIIRKHPDIVQEVVTGRYKGFKWAFENSTETVEILRKVNEGVDPGREIDAISPMKFLMITLETKKYGLGYISPKKWESVARDMFKAGLLEKMPDVRKVYTEKFPSAVLPK